MAEFSQSIDPRFNLTRFVLSGASKVRALPYNNSENNYATFESALESCCSVAGQPGQSQPSIVAS